ncbi:hypothetical protein OROHE_014641 [Orobanche hederae]
MEMTHVFFLDCVSISMDLDPTPSAPKKVRFAPKPPPRRKPKSLPAKIEPAVDDDEEAAQRRILSRI